MGARRRHRARAGRSVKTPPLPAFDVRVTPNIGTHYMTHSIYVGGKCIRSQLGPFGAGEAEHYVRAYMAPAEPPPLARALTAWSIRGKPGPKPKGRGAHPWTDNEGLDE